MGAITVDQLRRSPAKPIEKAEHGEVAIVTKDGRPLFLMVPYDKRMTREDVHVAVRLDEKEIVSLGRAASIAALNIPVVNNSPEELDREIASCSPRAWG